MVVMTALTDHMPPTTDSAPEGETLFEGFAQWALESGVVLYPHQEEAALELAAGSNVILATPTGSGKSMVALAAHFFALADFQRTGRRTYYTAPIKALVSEKFFDLVGKFGARNVGMITGDASVNADAPIIACTAEILANLALRDGEHLAVSTVVMDEFHFYSEPDRGWAWQVPLLTLPQAQFLLMSATLGDVSFFRSDLTARTGRETALVDNAERPVPLSFEYSTDPITDKLVELIQTRQAPVYVVHFTQKDALERAQALLSVQVASREDRDKILEMLGGFRFGKGFGTTLSKLIRHGIGVHHAGMLPKYRRIVETLAQAGLLKVVCGTDTLGVGINVPIRTVLLTGLTKFDGSRQRVLKVREFHQIAGRAGRAGFDTTGTVVVQAPEHVIENIKAEEKAAADPKKKKKAQKKKAPDGFVSWDENTFTRLVEGQPEPLVSRMRVTHAMVLDVIARSELDDADPVLLMRRLIWDSHEPTGRKYRLQRRGIEILRALKTADIVETFRLPASAVPGGVSCDTDDRIGSEDIEFDQLTPAFDLRKRLRLVDDLQDGFALNQPLSTFALAALELLDEDSPTYALDLLSVVEATLEDPRVVLWAQQRKAKGEAIAEMKADGIDYAERMELLENVSWPKPCEEMLRAAYDTYRQGRPWLTEDLLSPKTVVREMFENARGFGEFVRVYDLARSEGVVLRYLTDCYRALRQTVPEVYRTDEVDDIITWLGQLIRATDSSLLDEWEALTDPQRQQTEEVRPPEVEVRPITGNSRIFRMWLRQAMWRRVELLAEGNVLGLAELDSSAADVLDLRRAEVPPLTSEEWDDALAGYEDVYGEVPDSIGTGADARGPKFFRIDEKPAFEDEDPAGPGAEGHVVWQVEQILDDPEQDRDWRIVGVVDLTASDEVGELVVWVRDLTSVS
ncbi:DUF3516 domain-containing protein [Dermatophilus congolensis]|nr:DUF3516 domain-containing protein [Dermatophilus congolensis]MBO3151034.1 DUF3516 domain-containing protein [Dermatophilus congolensis]MBO3161962.1 DUF3516 domain-containing protein [Dermatophilus congolensis]MBO3162319.1 DUF3516 domain-containing protein [Dermatophilus congolensis]MBO3175873.1 DUF3516 domain-containing protein [Dermatophilus congolensis]